MVVVYTISGLEPLSLAYGSGVHYLILIEPLSLAYGSGVHYLRVRTTEFGIW